MNKEMSVKPFRNQSELLHYAIDSGIIDMRVIEEQIEMNERKKYLEMHPYKVWKGNNGKWYTYLPIPNEKTGRNTTMIKKSTENAVNEEIIKFYRGAENEPTMREVFNQWVQKKMEYGEIEKQTVDRYRRDYERFFESTGWEKRKIRYITEDELEDFIRSTIHKLNLTAKAWGNLRTLLNGMFRFAKKNGFTTISISAFMSELDLSKKVFAKTEKLDCENVFTEEELRKLSTYLQSKPTLNHLGILLAMYTGMRVGEVTGLKREDVHENYISVHRTQIRYKDDAGKDVYEIRDFPKTEAGNRKIVIGSKARPIVDQLLEMSRGRDVIFQKGDILVTIHALTCALYSACEKVGISKRSMHALRKTFGTHMLNARVEEAIITNQMGHTDIAVTKGHYYFNDKSMGQIEECVNKAINY